MNMNRSMPNYMLLDFSPLYTITNTCFWSNQSIWRLWSCYVQQFRRCITRKYIISPLTLTLGQGQTRNIAQYPLHHMTYAPAKFEAAMSNGLEGNAFTRNIWFDFNPRSRSHEALLSTSWLWPMYLQSWSCYCQWLWRRIYKKIH